MHSLRGAYVAFALSLVNNVEAFWRMNCAVVQRGRIDPLVNYGDIAAHSHTIVGGSNIGINATYQSLLNSQCTSCEIGADKSAYWSPTLYYSYLNGSFLEVPHDGAVAYYLGRGPQVNSTIPFPKGLNILSGDKSARSYDNQTYTWGNATYPGRPIADRVSFACLSYQPQPETPYMSDTDCPYGMRAQIHFQSCWNGKDLYKADNSHVAYQTQIDNGICPPTHPIQLPHIFLETLYSVANVPKENGGFFVFSQGDTTGYGFHGDFQNGWDSAVLRQAVQNCLSTDNFGQISECPVLQASQSDGYPYNCPERPPQIGEPVKGLISRLPGCITITNGPEAAPAASMNCPASSPKPSITRTVDSTPLATLTATPGASFGISSYQKYVGCFNDTERAVRALNAVSISNYSVMSVEWCQSWCQGKGYRLAGVEYGQECHCDNAMNPSAIADPSRCTWNCGSTMISGGNQEICGGYSYISIYNNTDPAFNANGSMENSAGAVQEVKNLTAFPSNYLGCATDNLNNAGRVLTGDSTTSLSMNTTVCQAYCAAANKGQGYQYYGTEYGSQCFCGNFISNGNVITNLTSTPSNSTCSMRCTGGGDQLCGGPNALSLYKQMDFVAPAIAPNIGRYVNKGCLTDPGGAAGRSLKGASTSSDSMTVNTCVKFCLGKFYRYAGLEYGRECYCDNTINYAGGAKTGTCDVNTLMLCAGNPKQYCGAGSLMNLYYSSTATVFE
ncbi:hypothetical protein AC579_6359 [Pseudocercospora musae]|uniref:WSC domain-containing protein n=1 Tax=Pseudocercospora musae TaxID=113226 RepID=A0A139HRT6_9PEZI|nr:hypothetical protein AC579_6359 [Pseudocercospora musae]